MTRKPSNSEAEARRRLLAERPHPCQRFLRTAETTLIACLLLVEGRSHAGILGSSINYSLEVSYATLPADDSGVERWLKGHTGIHNVNISRQPKSLEIKFEARRSLRAAILFELVKQCDSLGYQRRSWFRGNLFDPAQRGTRFQTFWVEYSKLPEDDRTMADWLKSHNGVSKIQVWREGKVVVFEFETATLPKPQSWAKY